ncbi:ribosomal protein S18-alanine N-acetyltransferase [Sinanaerobacter sp. ZZT-01]|uniref:ribosomal protein S18-alanine N-acetyltransferase n=1 Tax=Sinanaerobacter sp. ZZT-01 TaxID=3111540 RepID=UPI002D78208D|nr:ribosomal protein S18-alanine N-acetyltransferase [Sinanaerobacter sp. ZZT-01]WRR94405.1 ribosomal protein S18-alanine N-acetyltransferase [Sinanaerobacter sp. ZZT-01]
MNEILIREAEERDIKEMAKLDQMSFAMPWSVDSFHDEIVSNELAFYIVAEIQGKLIGYVGSWIILDEGHITHVAVNPDYRKKGVGHAMLSHLFDCCKEKGVLSHTLEVRPSNQAALTLYGQFGFKEAGRRKAYYENNGEDALILWRHTKGEPMKV